MSNKGIINHQTCHQNHQHPSFRNIKPSNLGQPIKSTLFNHQFHPGQPSKITLLNHPTHLGWPPHHRPTAWTRCRFSSPRDAEQLRHLQGLAEVAGTGVGHGVAELHRQLRLLLPGDGTRRAQQRNGGWKKWGDCNGASMRIMRVVCWSIDGWVGLVS